MKVSYTWLQEYVKSSLPAHDLAEKFRMTSSEAEEVIDWEARLEGVVVGHVKTLVQHPNADRLRVATVNVGNEIKTIVCGGTNLAQDQYVLVALPGTTLTSTKGESVTIQENKLRGVTSQGMICALEEIGIPIPSHHEIYVLPQPITVGTSAAKALDFDDQVIDLEITPNRPDLLSYIGLAREVSAFEKKRFSEPPITSLENETQNAPKLFDAVIESSKDCRRYSAVCMEGKNLLTPAPWWMQSRLLKAGMRPVNTIVDVTNYVMLELGQPMHAFDIDQLPKNKRGLHSVTVCTPKKEESLTLLDGSTRTLIPGDIIIRDAANEVIDLAGIMGGEHSSIQPTTTRIILESANFSGAAIRRTSRRLGLRSEASGRFEKGLDPEMTITALKRAVYLLQEICGAKISSQILDHYPENRQNRPRIHVSLDRVQQVLGVHISSPEAKSILQKLGFQIPLITKSSIEVIPPSWRADVRLVEDVIEELIRIWGFERIPATLPSGPAKPPFPNPSFTRRQRMREKLVHGGMYECVHMPFVSRQQIERVGLTIKKAIKLPNPISQESEYLSPSHVVQLLNNVATVNSAREEVGLFEIGAVFHAPSGQTERTSLLLRSSSSPELLYRRLKGQLEYALEALSIGILHYQTSNEAAAYYTEGSAQDILVAGTKIGTIGMISPDVIAQFKIRRGRHVAYAQIEMEALLSLPDTTRYYTPGLTFPSIERDLTFILDEHVTIQQLEELVTKTPSTTLHHWLVTDIYRGKPLATNQKSVTLHFIYNGKDRTLEEKEVTDHQQKLISRFRTELNAHINE